MHHRIFQWIFRLIDYTIFSILISNDWTMPDDKIHIDYEPVKIKIKWTKSDHLCETPPIKQIITKETSDSPSNLKANSTNDVPSDFDSDSFVYEINEIVPKFIKILHEIDPSSNRIRDFITVMNGIFFREILKATKFHYIRIRIKRDMDNSLSIFCCGLVP